jgi:NADH:ubiquinone oxidoreductase subunit 4 (subunit M)
MFNRVVFGTLKITYMQTFTDVNGQENIILLLLAIMTIIFGVSPWIVLDLFKNLNYLVI